MSKIGLVLSFLMLISMTTNIRLNDNEEFDAIKAASMDYVEGWYEGDAERMQRSLHPNLVKRRVRNISKTRRPTLIHISKTTLLEYTRAGGGTDTPKNKLFYELEVLDIYKGMATVKAVSANYVDYLHLVKWNGRWLIVNILWDER